jgi:hypothetical protein
MAPHKLLPSSHDFHSCSRESCESSLAGSHLYDECAQANNIWMQFHANAPRFQVAGAFLSNNCAGKVGHNTKKLNSNFFLA